MGLGGSRVVHQPTIDFTGFALIAAVSVAFLCLAFAVILFAGLWMALHGPLRSLLEVSPLSGSIAERAKGEGNPLQVGAVIAALVMVAMVVASIWRRSVVGRVVNGESPLRALYLSSLLRTVLLFAGLGLVVTGAGIAAGADLPGRDFIVRPPGEGGEASGGLGSAVLFLSLASAAIGTYTFISANRVWKKITSGRGA